MIEGKSKWFRDPSDVVDYSPKPTSQLVLYLCGGINGLSDSDCRDWREAAKERLAEHFTILDPMRRDYRGREAECVDEIVDGDFADLNLSDLTLVNANQWPESQLANRCIRIAGSRKRGLMLWAISKLTTPPGATQ